MLKDSDTVGDLVGELSDRVDRAFDEHKAASEVLTLVSDEVKRLTKTQDLANARSYMNDYKEALKHPADFLGPRQLVKDVFTGFKPQLTKEMILELETKLFAAEQAVAKAEAKYKTAKGLYNNIMETIQT